MLDDGRELEAELLGFDLGLSLAVGRASKNAVGGEKYFEPLKVAPTSGLIERRWLLTLTHDEKGRPQPYAGIVEVGPKLDLTRRTPLGEVTIAEVGVPSRRGSPVLSPEGELVGVALIEGERRTHVAPVEIVIPVVKAVVVGRDTH
jgi:hypothetical protein